MQKRFNHNKGIFLFNIIPRYRSGMSNVFDYARDSFSAAVLPSESQRLKQNTLFIRLENICGECLTELDLLYLFATDAAELVMGEFESDYAKINWVNPGTFTPSEPAGALTFTPNVGFQGDGAATYFDTGYIASTHAVQYTQNDASAFCYLNNEGTVNRVDFGVNSGVSDPSLRLVSRDGSAQHSCRINAATAVTRGTSVTSTGFFQVQRTASNVSKIFKNGSQVGADITSISAGVPLLTLPLLANNNNGSIGTFSNRQMGIFGLGASLSGSESALYSAWNNYFTSL